MEMEVIGITNAGNLGDSNFTIAVFKVINNSQVVAFVAIDPAEKRGLQARFQGSFGSFLLVNEAGFAELRKRDASINTLGHCNSADIAKRQIVAPAEDQEP